jgi:GT2 family glycosyltransferase
VLLSIVECSDYRKYRGNGEWGDVQKSQAIELIGPVIHKNIASMRNLGASKSTGSWIFFKDKDCQVDSKKLTELIEKYSDYDVIGGVYSNFENKSYYSKVYHEIQRKWLLKGILNKGKGLPQTRHVLGGALAIKKSVLEEMGGFSEKIGWGAEETELLARLIRSQKKVGICYSLKVRHKHNLGLLGFIKRAWKQNFNLIYYVNPKPQISSLKVNYLRSIFSHLPGIALFFSVAKLAQSAALILRSLKRIR